jgi:hypothetical protein
MPDVKHLSRFYLEMVWNYRVRLEKTPVEIWMEVFKNNLHVVTFPYLCTLCCSCDSSVEDERAKKSDPLTAAEEQSILKLARISFVDINAPIVLPIIKLAGRFIKKTKTAQEALQCVSLLQDHNLRRDYLKRAAPFFYNRFVDVAETLSSKKKFMERYGYAPTEELALRSKFCINGKQYNAICAYSPIGVLAYRVFQGVIDIKAFQSFLENDVNNSVLPDMIGLLDYPTIPYPQGVRNAMHKAFDGNYLFAPPFSPDMKPVEQLFAEVSKELTLRTEDAILDPIGVISECFELFTVTGPKVDLATEHFALYRTNFNKWHDRYHGDKGDIC